MKSLTKYHTRTDTAGQQQTSNMLIAILGTPTWGKVQITQPSDPTSSYLNPPNDSFLSEGTPKYPLHQLSRASTHSPSVKCSLYYCNQSHKESHIYHEWCLLNGAEQFIDRHRQTKSLINTRLTLHVGLLWCQCCTVQYWMKILQSTLQHHCRLKTVLWFSH